MGRVAGHGQRTWPGLALSHALVIFAGPALAGPIKNRVAVFAALDKITGDITTLKVPMDEVARFGTFRIRPRTCHTRPPTETPKTMAFVEIEEFTYDKKRRRVFSGWMNAESPGLHAVEHPLFDVWLTGCREPLGEAARAATPATPATPTSLGAPAATDSADAGNADEAAGPSAEAMADDGKKSARRGFVAEEGLATGKMGGTRTDVSAQGAAESGIDAMKEFPRNGAEGASHPVETATGEQGAEAIDAARRRALYDLDLSQPRPGAEVVASPKTRTAPSRPGIARDTATPEPAPPAVSTPGVTGPTDPSEEIGPLY